MEIIERKYEVYKFNELDEKVKEKVIDNFRNGNALEYIYEAYKEDVIDNFKIDMEKLAIKVDKVYYSGFWSQGDGASFTADINACEYIEANKLQEKYPLIYKWVKEVDNVYYSIYHSGHYYHEYTMHLNASHGNFNDVEEYKHVIEDASALEKEIEAFDNYLLEDARERASKLYKQLEDEYNGVYSHEFISEYLNDEAYNYNFLADGTIFS